MCIFVYFWQVWKKKKKEKKKKQKKHFMATFLWMGLNCLKVTEPLQGDSLLFKN